jgi:ABC-type transport system substrate-binding protein
MEVFAATYHPHVRHGWASGRDSQFSVHGHRGLDEPAQTPAIVVWSFDYFHAESQYFVSLLRELGYRARLHYVADIGAYFDTLSETPSAQAGFFGWFGLALAVDTFSTLGCNAGAENPAHFCDRQIDTQVARLAKQEPADPAGTAGVAAAVDREITNQAPWVPLFTPRFADLTSARVGNYEYNNGFSVSLDQLWVRWAAAVLLGFARSS